MNQSSNNLKDKVVEALIKTIDSSEHNDLVIKLSDGQLHASKLILASRSDYFQTMFSAQRNFKENLNNEVSYNCKVIIMKPIIRYIYGSKIDISSLSCSDVIEVLDMLRILMLEQAIFEVQELFKIQLREQAFSINDCYQAYLLSETKRMENVMCLINSHFARNMDVIISKNKEILTNLSEDSLYYILDYVKKIEDKFNIPTPSWLHLRKLNFIIHWLENKSSQIHLETKTKIKPYFKLEYFTVTELLNEVFNSKLFDQTEIFSAIETVHNKIMIENKKLKNNLELILKM